jgi:hypothetical protein
MNWSILNFDDFFSIFNSTLKNDTHLSQVFQKKQNQGNFPQAILSQRENGFGGEGGYIQICDSVTCSYRTSQVQTANNFL